MVKKIVVIGPESTGKSTLCELLAQHFKAEWCPEFARDYLLTHGTQYSYNDLALIAKGQLALEDNYTQRVTTQWKLTKDSKTYINSYSLQTTLHSPLLFIDTDMYVMKVWCEYVFNKCHNFINEEIKKRQYDLYLLCQTDLPWVKDELREYPNETPRKELFDIYHKLLTNQYIPFKIISGNYEERLQQAVEAVKSILQ